MPKFVRARPPLDDGEARKTRRPAGARHAPADWNERTRIAALSWDGLAVSAIAGQLGCHPNRVRRWLPGSTPRAPAGWVTAPALGAGDGSPRQGPWEFNAAAVRGGWPGIEDIRAE
jgi:hypothetical protein